MVRRWCRQFTAGRQHVHDEERSGSSSIITNDLVELVREQNLENRRFIITELNSYFPQISRSSLNKIVTEHLLFRKLCGSWVPKQLTPELKAKRIESALTFLWWYTQMHKWLTAINKQKFTHPPSYK